MNQVTFTGVIVSVNQVSQNLSNYLPPGAVEKFSPEEKANAVYGSKFVMILEEFMLANTWLCKACLLMLYHQMTYFISGFGAGQYSNIGKCPLTTVTQCASYYNHLITSAVFNITSDLMMIYIPLPILVRARLPTKRKVILCGVFSLAILVTDLTSSPPQILCAILNRYYNFTAGFGSLIYLNWYVGEAATSVFVANVPHLWPLLSRIFSLGAFNSLRRTGNSSGNPADSSSRFNKVSAQRRHHPSDGYMRSESEERIASAGAGAGTGTWPLPATPASDGAALELGPMDDKGMGYMASAAGGEGNEKGEARGGIMRTVQIRQYSSS
ncbi:MAG: hypothetical protein Q9219_006357 [cf. Caloplaca sp. 3 TL-2023]